MAFSKNHVRLVRFDDPLLQLNKKQLAYLEASWGGFFAQNIFPLIQEERFGVLYSEGRIGRYNNPINHLVGLLLLKDLFRYSTQTLLYESVLDLRFKYALHCTDKLGAPVSAGALSKFKTRCNQYQKKTGRDLLGEEYDALQEPLLECIRLYRFQPAPRSKLAKTLAEKC